MNNNTQLKEIIATMDDHNQQVSSSAEGDMEIGGDEINMSEYLSGLLDWVYGHKEDGTPKEEQNLEKEIADFDKNVGQTKKKDEVLYKKLVEFFSEMKRLMNESYIDATELFDLECEINSIKDDIINAKSIKDNNKILLIQKISKIFEMAKNNNVSIGDPIEETIPFGWDDTLSLAIVDKGVEDGIWFDISLDLSGGGTSKNSIRIDDQAIEFLESLEKLAARARAKIEKINWDKRYSLEEAEDEFAQ